MPLRSCRGCGREVDTTAKSCPNCGRPHPTNSGWGIGKIAVGIVMVLFMTCTVRACIDASEKPPRNSSSPPRGRDPIATEATDQFSAIADLLPDEAGDLVLMGAFVEGSGQGRRASIPNPSDWSAEGRYAWRNGASGDDLRLSVASLRCFAKSPDSSDKPLCGPGSQKRKLQIGIDACLLPRDKQESTIGGLMVEWPGCSLSFKWNELDNRRKEIAWAAAEDAASWVRQVRAMRTSDSAKTARSREHLQVAIHRTTAFALSQNRK